MCPYCWAWIGHRDWCIHVGPPSARVASSSWTSRARAWIGWLLRRPPSSKTHYVVLEECVSDLLVDHLDYPARAETAIARMDLERCPPHLYRIGARTCVWCSEADNRVEDR